MTKGFRVGVVGVGYLGRFHALIWSRLAGAELVGVVDTHTEAAEKVAEEAGCRAYPDAAALIDAGLDAVSIVVPTSLHREISLPFLHAGIHMLLEKPIADSRENAEAIVSAATRAGVILQIGHLERFNAGIMALAQRIQQPRFIEAHRMGGFVDRATDVDVVSDLMIHDIDIILSLVQSEIVHISAAGTPVLTEHVDIANARLEFANGAVANVIASRVSENRLRRIRVFEPKRYQSLDFIEQTLDLAWPEPRDDRKWPEIVTERVAIEPVKPLDAEIAAFMNCCQSHARPLVSGEDGLAALDVALQVKQKITT
ncbi:MAG TPA: Gfo/Idh/MocA family oxidoreductase [Chromatiaceae bacterium]|nr:Gfo/Idh/MocA family oxidoreductase [Chromatiaceae bacterium]